MTSLIEDGSNLPNQGATINSAQSTVTVLVRSNDDPHGIVGWLRTIVIAQETEATNNTVRLLVERRAGVIGDIKVSFSTVMARTNVSVNERPALPGKDFIPVSDEVLMANGVNLTNISIRVIHVSLTSLYCSEYINQICHRIIWVSMQCSERIYELRKMLGQYIG